MNSVSSTTTDKKGISMTRNSSKTSILHR
jgi:hypothetical protein